MMAATDTKTGERTAERDVIVCAALNPAVDRRLQLKDSLRPGVMQRAVRSESTAGGKGLNVARVAHSLGRPVLAVGFAGGANGAWIRERLNVEGVHQQWIEVGQDTRVCLNLVDEQGVSTEVLEPGPEIADDEAIRFLALWREVCTPGRWLTLSGSLPRGLDPEFYGMLIEVANRQGAHAILDASGDALVRGAKRGPHTIKPNEDEFRQWFYEDPRDAEAVRRCAERLGRSGLETLIVSLGGDGCLASRPDGELWRATPPSVRAVNAVGSGDAFVAGWADACARGLEMPEALRWATAAGAANAESPVTGGVRLEDAVRLAEQVELERL